jgi:1-acyl-sn-glycerol-3-phosphate acyltransferase
VVLSLAWRLLNVLQLVVLCAWTACWITLALLVTVLSGGVTGSLALARRVWAPGVLAGLGIRLRVVGQQHARPAAGALFVANHSSSADVPLLFAALPVNIRYLVKAELGRVPFLGWYVRSTGMVLIDRKHPAGARASLARVIALLKSGASVVAFPEGSRNISATLAPFKPGAFKAAIASGTPVIPVAIHGSGRAWPPHTLAARPGRVVVKVGAPLETSGLGHHDHRELANRAREQVQALLDSL